MVGEKGQKLRELADKVDEVERVEGEQQEIEEDLKTNKWLEQQSLDNHDNLVKLYAEEFNLSLTTAKKDLDIQLKQYQIEGKDIPMLIKDLRKHRRTLKGEEKVRLTDSIDNLIKAYSDHLDKSIDKIYWINKYKPLIKDMVCSETDLVKLGGVGDMETRRELIDQLCKYWEVKLERNDMPLNKKYFLSR